MNIKNLKLRLPQKSLFGFKVLGCSSSLIFAYLFVALFLISRWFVGHTFAQELAKELYVFLSNLSFLILLINGFNKRYEIRKKVYFLISFPLLVYMPFSIFTLIKVSAKFLLVRI